MAELIRRSPAWTSAQARDQLAAVAWLRWRIFVHSFRYRGKKRSATGMAVLILARVFAYSVAALFFVGPVVGSGAAGYYAVAHHHPEFAADLLWAIFSISLFVSINISPANIGFDLTPLLRFPLNLWQYLSIRLFFGLVAIPIVVANLALAAAAIGIGVADHALFPWAALVLAVFALHNVFFIRMIFAWVDRWMGTRRAREIFGAIVILVSLGVQLAFTGNPRHSVASLRAIRRFTARMHPVLQYLPPSLAADAILDWPRHAGSAALASLAGVFAFAAVFLCVFALRLRKEFQGENLSEANRRTARPERARRGAAPSQSAAGETAPADPRGFRLPPTIAACLQKEWIYLKRSGAQLYGLITPIFLVFILTRRNQLFSNTPMLLPYAVSYVMLGLLANLYNVLGADGAGYNLYLLAPIRMRDVILSKNLINGSVIVIEVLLACLAVGLINGGVPPASMLAATLTWALFAMLANMTVGNLRSIFAPRRFELGKMRRAPASKGSGFISMGVFAATAAVGIPTILICRAYGLLWMATPIFAVLACAALAGYLIVLSRIDAIATDRREDMAEALTKADGSTV